MRVFSVSVLMSVATVSLAACGLSQETADADPPSPPAVRETVDRVGVEDRAIAAVTAYFDRSAEIAAEGGARPERIEDVVTAAWLSEELTGFDALRALGARQVGKPVVTRIEVSAIRGISAVTEIVLHACTETSAVQIRTSDGLESPAGAGVSRVTVYVVPERGVLKVDNVNAWADVSWCVAE